MTAVPRATTTARARSDPRAAAAMLISIMLVAVNLRAAITSVGALLDEVRTGLHLSGAMAGLVTTLPTVSFAAVGAFTPWLSRRLGPARLVVAAMTALAAGQLLRAATGSPVFFVLSSAIALSGIAVANVLLPAIVKQHFPERTGVITGVYMMTLITGTSVAAATAVPIAHATGSWRYGIGVWGLLAVVAVLPWLRPAVLGTAGPERAAAATGTAAEFTTDVEVAQVEVVPPDHHARRIRPGRTGLGWAMAIYFGMQSLSGYATMGWLPQIFRDASFPPATAGLLLAAVPAFGIPIALLMPTLGGRRDDLRPLVLTMSVAMITSYLGLALAPHGGALLWVVLLALGQGAFPLALAMIGMRARTHEGVVALSAFAQSMGYLLAASGPLLVGILYEMTHGWRVPIGFLIAAALVQAAAGLAAARPRFIEDH